jgi:hypothetical protein
VSGLKQWWPEYSFAVTEAQLVKALLLLALPEHSDYCACRKCSLIWNELAAYGVDRKES